MVIMHGMQITRPPWRYFFISCFLNLEQTAEFLCLLLQKLHQLLSATTDVVCFLVTERLWTSAEEFVSLGCDEDVSGNSGILHDQWPSQFTSTHQEGQHNQSGIGAQVTTHVL